MKTFFLATLLLTASACRIDQQLGSLGNDGPPMEDLDGAQSPSCVIMTSGALETSDQSVIMTRGGLETSDQSQPSSCHLDCGRATTCEVTCEGDCTVNCGAVPCRVNCAPGARCEMTCTQAPAASCPAAGVSACNGARC
jgi:hypothetical protein